MTGGIKHCRKMFTAELRVRLHSSKGLRPCGSGCYIRNQKVKMHLLLLPALFLRPDAGHVILLLYKQENHAVFTDNRGMAEQLIFSQPSRSA